MAPPKVSRPLEAAEAASVKWHLYVIALKPVPYNSVLYHSRFVWCWGVLAAAALFLAHGNVNLASPVLNEPMAADLQNGQAMCTQGVVKGHMCTRALPLPYPLNTACWYLTHAGPLLDEDISPQHRYGGSTLSSVAVVPDQEGAGPKERIPAHRNLFHITSSSQQRSAAVGATSPSATY